MLEREKPETTGEKVLGGLLYIVLGIIGYLMILWFQGFGLGFEAATILTSAILVAFLLFGHRGWYFVRRLFSRST